MLNKHAIIGRLGQTPEIRYVGDNNAVTTVSIATSEKYTTKDGEKKENTQWHRVTFWGKLAELVGKYLDKGSLVFVEGPSETREYEDKDGIKRYSTEIKARELKFLSSKGDTGGQAPAAPTQGGAKIDKSFDEMDDDLPF